MDHHNYLGTTKLAVPDPIDYRLNRGCPHSKFGTRPFYPCGKIVAHFILILWIKLSAKKSGDIFWFDRMNCCAG